MSFISWFTYTYDKVHFHNLFWLPYGHFKMNRSINWAFKRKGFCINTPTAIHFLFFRDENVSKHLAQMSHCKTLSREDCKIPLNLNHLCFVLLLDGSLFTSSPRYFYAEGTTLGHIVRHTLGIFDLPPQRSNREIEQYARGIYGNRPKYDWNLSLCFMLTDSNNCSTPLPSCWGLVAASVWRSKTWLKHKPSHLPSPCPAPPRPRLLLNQLFWFTPLSVCQNEPNVFLFPPAAKQPGGFRVLQRIAVLIQTLGFAESAGPGAALLCISVPWQS